MAFEQCSRVPENIQNFVLSHQPRLKAALAFSKFFLFVATFLRLIFGACSNGLSSLSRSCCCRFVSARLWRWVQSCASVAAQTPLGYHFWLARRAGASF